MVFDGVFQSLVSFKAFFPMTIVDEKHYMSQNSPFTKHTLESREQWKAS